MRIYVDEVFVLNVLINAILLRTASLLTGGSIRRLRLWGAAVFGGIYAVAVLLPRLGWLGSLPGQLGAFAAMSLIAYGAPARAWRPALWFLGVCCAFGGLTFAATRLLRVPVLWRAGRVYYRLSMRLLLLLAGGLYLLCRLLLDRFARHRGRELVPLVLELEGAAVQCTALRDTGNTLLDPLSGEPVLVAGWQVAARLLPELGLRRQQFAQPGELLRLLHLARPGLTLRLIPYRAVGTDSALLLALRCGRVIENGRDLGRRLVAFSPTELSDGGSYEALCQAE